MFLCPQHQTTMFQTAALKMEARLAAADISGGSFASPEAEGVSQQRSPHHRTGWGGGSSP